MSKEISETDRPKMSHNMESKYAVLQETNEAEMETWLYFLRYDGNEKELEHLRKKLESVESIIIEDSSVFVLDDQNLVSAQTAKQMTKVELNAHQWHRKFDGKLQKIKFKFKDDDDDETKVMKIFDKLGYGQIDEYISDEDIDSCDITVNDESSSDEENESDNDNDVDNKKRSVVDESNSDESDDSDDEKKKSKKVENPTTPRKGSKGKPAPSKK